MPIYTSDLNSSGIIYADTITTNSNEDITLNPAGTGQVVVDSNLNLTDNSYLYIGTGNDLRIYHTGTNSHIEDWGDGDLYIKASNNAFFQGKNSNHVIQQWGDFGGNGFTKLRYGNVEVFETVSGGVKIFGNAEVQGSIYTDTITTTGSNDDITISANGTGDVVIGSDLAVNQIKSDDSTNIRVADNLVPAADDTYSLGTPDRKWSALYVTGSTIFMDDTKLQVDGSGDFTVKDASNNLKRVVASEVEIGSGSNKIKIQRGANGRVKFTDENDSPTSVLQIVGDDSTGVSLNTNETIKIEGGNGIQTAVSGDTLTITGSTGGFTNSTETSFPITDDSTATDFSDDEPEGLGTSASGTDAFGVAISGVYDCMEPVGHILTTDLAGSESYVGA